MEGIECQTEEGNVLKCHVMLANCFSDLPEEWDLLGGKGQNSSFPDHKFVFPKKLVSIPSP